MSDLKDCARGRNDGLAMALRIVESEVQKIAPNAYVDYARAGETYRLDNGGCTF